jgi:AraC family transcriptional regulator
MRSNVKDSSRGGRAGIVDHSQERRENLRILPDSERRDSTVSDITLIYPEAVVASSDVRGWQNIRVIRLRSGLNDLVVPPADSHCLLLNLGKPLRLSAHFDSREFEGKVHAGEVAIIPAHSSWTSRSPGSNSSTVLLLYFRPLFIRSAVPDFSYSTIGLRPQIGFRNNQIRHLAMSLLQELNETNLADRFYADSLALGLAVQLVRRYSSLPQIHLGSGGMAPHKLRKAIAIIEHHLADKEEGKVALRIVARQVGMSYFHFSRVFKQSMGMSPTNYIAERRIERAKELLNETELPISEIALRSGFSSQSHFHTAFRKLAGTTPRVFRAAI